MLKIKDNLDLKELKQYGFNRPQYLYYYLKFVKLNGYEEYIEYFVSTKTREISITGKITNKPIDNTLYDLIKDGLVEKVEDENNN